MTRLEQHDLKMANEKAANRQKRIDLLLQLIQIKTNPRTALTIIRDYRSKALSL